MEVTGGVLFPPQPMAGMQMTRSRVSKPAIRRGSWPRRRVRATKSINRPARPKPAVASEGAFGHETSAELLDATREVVVMVTVWVTGVPLTVKAAAGAVQLAPVGAGLGPVQVRVTVVVPATGVKVRTMEAGEPAVTVCVTGPVPFGPLMVKSAVWPMPVRLAVVAPLVVTVRVPVRVPTAVGLKETVTMQVALAASIVPQVLV